MKTKTLIQSAVDHVLEKGIKDLGVMPEVKRVCNEKPFGSLAYHYECDFSTLSLQQPYSFFTEDYEARKQEHLKSIEVAKKNEELTIIRADETTLQYSYDHLIEDDGDEERVNCCWLNEVSKAHLFSIDAVEEIAHDKTFLMTYVSYQGEITYLGVYGSLEKGIADLKALIPFFKKVYPVAVIEANENSDHVIERIKMIFPQESQNFDIRLESIPFHAKK